MKFVLRAIILTLPFSASAEIEKLVLPCETQLCFYWWPKLPNINGWAHDRQNSYRYRANAQAPVGLNFGNAESVIYAKALYKPRVPEFEKLQSLIDSDIEGFKNNVPGIRIDKSESIIDADGKELVSYTFSPPGSGNWERVSYGEEGDFYLVFTLSSRSESGYKENLPTYYEFINNYKESP